MIEVHIEVDAMPPEPDEYDDDKYGQAEGDLIEAVVRAINAGARRDNIEAAVAAGLENAGAS
jgi:hypothetical protein